MWNTSGCYGYNGIITTLNPKTFLDKYKPFYKCKMKITPCEFGALILNI